MFGEIENVQSNMEQFLGSLATFTFSAQTEAESESFVDLQTAIDLLLYSGSRETPSAVVMREIFGVKQSNNMNIQALYMILAQLGRYVRYYGNTNETGIKNSGTNGNPCFLDYDPLILALLDPTDTCALAAQKDGSPGFYLSPGNPSPNFARRVCQGVMLFNNLVDILENISFSSNDSLGEVANIQNTISNLLPDTTAYPQVSDFLNNLSQSECEDFIPTDNQNIHQIFFALVFEKGLP